MNTRRRSSVERLRSSDFSIGATHRASPDPWKKNPVISEERRNFQACLLRVWSTRNVIALSSAMFCCEGVSLIAFSFTFNLLDSWFYSEVILARYFRSNGNISSELKFFKMTFWIKSMDSWKIKMQLNVRNAWLTVQAIWIFMRAFLLFDALNICPSLLRWAYSLLSWFCDAGLIFVRAIFFRVERVSRTHVSLFLRAREKIEDRSSTGKVSVKDALKEVKKGNIRWR